MEALTVHDIPLIRGRLAREFDEQAIDTIIKCLFPSGRKPYDIPVPADEVARQKQEGPPSGAIR